MAYTSIHTIRATVSAAIAYITNGDKTVNGIYVNSYACRSDSAGASEDFRTVRGTGTGRTQILAYHMIQSFAPGEVTPEQAMQIGEELCDRYLKGDYQYVIAVHNDKDHLHCHIIFNNTNLYNGLSFTTEHNQGRKSERAWAELREISDEICAEHGISVIEPIGKGVSHYENEMQKEGKSWKDKLRVRIAEVMLYSRDFKDFLEKCSECGIEYVYKPSNKVKLKFRLSGDGQQKFTRADTLGADFTPERIAEQIAEIQEKLSAANVTPDMLIETPKPVVPKTEPKPTQTVTVQTKPKQSAEPEAITETSETAKRKAAAEQVEKFFAARRARRQAQLDMLNATATKPAEPKPEPSALTPQPTPTESKAPEKKEDPWKAIRGMGRADEIIADLEAGGVMSFSELSGFFFNTPHSDDHTTELADLKKRFTAIDTLIAKMKHRDELEPVYKEYQGKSGWSQSRFKKKNAATIEDYEATVKYIKEHIKRYAVDGKPPTMLDLLEKSNKLKSKWNRLNVEHTAFLTKRETAKKYTRQVRQYINEQQMKREREHSRQRTQAKQKKSYLE
ncbi:relaxase/mobilization nuclease domain protein [Ruminococcus albus 8]|uniref:Relaxase/mobilization nuclease domain protein n=1 Tax=Ruminococcus albus 8 TaxID=246199 RepID=E9S8F9_RUMAL|nr:relaxase/mobilization nuclease domain protein [Ruminococcus albus 8]MCC3352383.1 relaxase/mobilization nuclease domain-containing protein [Ruminococcus albus 8]